MEQRGHHVGPDPRTAREELAADLPAAAPHDAAALEVREPLAPSASPLVAGRLDASDHAVAIADEQGLPPPDQAQVVTQDSGSASSSSSIRSKRTPTSA